MHRQITKKVIESISTPDTRELLLRDTELKGFGIRISPSGTKTFFAEGFFKPKGVGKRLSLGRYPVISIDEARLKARKILYQLYSGIDPRLTDNKIAEKTHQITLHQLLDKYCSARTLKSEGDYRRVTKRVFGDWFDKPVRSISIDTGTIPIEATLPLQCRFSAIFLEYYMRRIRQRHNLQESINMFKRYLLPLLLLVSLGLVGCPPLSGQTTVPSS